MAAMPSPGSGLADGDNMELSHDAPTPPFLADPCTCSGLFAQTLLA